MKNIKFFTLKKAHCVIALCVLLCIATVCATYFTVKATVSPKAVHTIVIDAGHGGKDGGAVGKTTDVTESFLNLQYSAFIAKILLQISIDLVRELHSRSAGQLRRFKQTGLMRQSSHSHVLFVIFHFATFLEFVIPVSICPTTSVAEISSHRYKFPTGEIT